MAAPLSGVGQQQQVPLSQSLLPNGTDQSREIRQKDQAPREREVQARGAELNKSQDTSTENAEFSLQNLNLSSASAPDRGSLVDITV